MSDKKIEKKVVDFSAHGEKTLKQFVTEKLQSGISEELLPRTEHDFNDTERTVSEYERMFHAVKERINKMIEDYDKSEKCALRLSEESDSEDEELPPIDLDRPLFEILHQDYWQPEDWIPFIKHALSKYANLVFEW